MSNIPPIQPNPGFSNYPRGGFPPPGGGYPRPPGVYFEAIGEAWRIIQGNLGGWVVLSMCYLVVSNLVTLPVYLTSDFLVFGNPFAPRQAFPGFDKPILSWGINALGILVVMPLHAGLLMTCLKAVRGSAVGPGDLWCGYAKTFSLIPGYILVGILTFGSFILCIIPSIYVTGVLVFVPLLILDRNMSPTQAIEESYRALKSDGWTMFLLVFASALLAACGGCLCGIGLIFTLPIYSLTIAITYNYYFPPASQNPYGAAISQEPPPSWG